MITRRQFVIGQRADGSFVELYCGEDGGEAERIYENPPEGVTYREWHRNPAPFRRGQTEEGVAIDSAQQAAAEERSAELRAKAAAEAKAKAEAEAKARAEAAAKQKQEAARREQERTAATAADRAAVHQKLADEAKAEAAGAVLGPKPQEPPPWDGSLQPEPDDDTPKKKKK